MSDLHVEISAQVHAQFPALRVTGIIATPPAGGWPLIGLVGPDDPPGPDEVAAHPRISIWRRAVKTMGLKPAERRSSVEQLLRRWLAGRFPETGVDLVDAYNALSLRWLAPMGAYDMDALGSGPLELRSCDPERDCFNPLGAEAADFPLTSGVVVYALGSEVLCWALNVRDAIRTSVSPATKRVLLLSESLDDPGRAASASAMAAFAAIIVHQGGQASVVKITDQA